MHQFVICEDEDLVQQKIKMILSEMNEKLNCQYNVQCYRNYTASLERLICDCNPKIYILDVNLSGKNDFDIAKKIREIDRKSCIILMTKRDDLLGRALKERLQLLDYIFKDDDDLCYERLKETIEIAIKVVKNFQENILFLQEKNNLYPIDFDKIIYVHREAKERKLIIHTNKREYRILKNLTDLISQLDNRFFICHRSCIVNIQYIKSIDLTEESITFKNNDKIFLLSRSRKKELYDRTFHIK